MIKLTDLKAQYALIQKEIDEALRTVLGRADFIKGEDVGAFEKEFAAYCGVKGCVGVGNGTDAVYLALRALGVGPGDEVITVTHTFIATSEAISLTGAKPVFVDVLEDTLLMDPAALERAVTPRTKAVVPVHLYGQMCDMDAVLSVARAKKLKVVEDAAQAHGARWKGRRAGSFGDAACFSFFPGKNLGAYGDAGGVVSDDEDLLKRVRMLANHGRLSKYAHEREGVNSRLDTMQAAVLRVKLRHLDAGNGARRRWADAYRTLLAGAPFRLPVVRAEAEPVWHQFVVRVPSRDKFQEGMTKREIETGVHYPLPLHLQPAYASFGLKAGAFPRAEKAAGEILSLPMYPELDDQKVSRVAEALTSLAKEILS